MALNFSKNQPKQFRTVRPARVVEVRPDGMTEEEYSVLEIVTKAAMGKLSCPTIQTIAEKFGHTSSWASKMLTALETMGKLRSVGVGCARQFEIIGNRGLRTGPYSWVWKYMDNKPSRRPPA